MKKLNNHVFKGLLISTCVKSSWDLVQRLGRGKGGGRLVVRNLGFEVSIPDLRTVFARFGALHSITLPVDPVTFVPRGFAFIYYLSKSSAEKALEAVNATRIHSEMARERIDSEGGKGGKKQEVRKKKKAEEKEAGGGGGERGRVVAVDWALGKDEYKRAQVEEKAEQEVDGESGSEEESDEEKEEDEDSDMSPVPEGEDEEAMDDDKHADDDDDELDEEPVGPEPPKGTTLFVRNMSFEATEAELYDLFVPSCRLSRSTLTSSVQVQGLRTCPLRSYRLRLDYEAISRNCVRLLLERRRCPVCPASVRGSQRWSLWRGASLLYPPLIIP